MSITHSTRAQSWEAMKDETWKDVPGYERKYQVSDCGRVRSLLFINRHGSHPRKTPLVLTPFMPTGGYPRVSMCKGNVAVNAHVHSLVLLGFKGERPTKRHVGGHRDGNPANNHLSNLDWITFKENEADKIRHGRGPIGEKNPSVKLSNANVLEIRRLRSSGMKLSDIGRLFSISKTNAADIAKRRIWRHL